MMDECCDNCRFFELTATDMGSCRRHSPVIDIRGFDLMFPGEIDQHPYRALQGMHPEVSTDMWCGEYEERMESA